MDRMQDVKFGTSGVRGLAAALTGGMARRYAAAFARHLVASGSARPGDAVLVGRDLRDSSPQIMAECLAGLAAAGLRGVDCGVLPTPALALHALAQGRAAVMVTGSHIPADRNGLKFYTPAGEITKEDERAITGLLAEGVEDGGSADFGGAEPDPAPVEAYRDRYLAALAPDALKGLRVGVYEHSSVSAGLITDTLARLGADVVRLGRSDAFVPVDTEALEPEVVERLRGWASSEGLDAVVSTDPDGDRPLVADETGAVLRGDLLGLIVARLCGADAVVTPVSSNSGIGPAMGFQVVRTQIGSPYVIEGIARAIAEGRRAVIGFEANGGVVAGTPLMLAGARLDALPTRDALLPILAALLHRVSSGVPLSQAASGWRLPVCAAGLVREVPAERSKALLDRLRGSRGELAGFLDGIGAPGDVDETDGVRVFIDGGEIVHFRASGNAPEMRCYVEAASAARADALLAEGIKRIRRALLG